MFLATLRKMFSPKPGTPIRKPARRALGVESLEDRSVPATFTVGSGYATIQLALNAAAASSGDDTVAVPAGTYTEAVTINDAGKVTLKATGNVTIKSPANVPLSPALLNVPIGSAIIDIYSKNVTVDGFKVDGSTNTDGELFAGIRVLKDGSATIKNNTVTNIGTVVPPVDAQAGIGIQVGTTRTTGTIAKGTAKVTNNVVNTYKKVGIMADGAGASATIKGNTVTGNGGGEGGNGGIVQYGIQSSTGASARVESNNVSKNTAIVGGVASGVYSAGILVVDNANGRSNVVAKNTVSNNAIGIFVDNNTVTGSGGELDVVNNDVTGSTAFAGIFVKNSSGVEVENNDVFNNTAAFNGIAVTESVAGKSHHNEIDGNSIHNNANADGIYVFGGRDNTIECNDSYANGYNGIFVEQSNNNWVWSNSTRSNGVNGIKVLGGTGNDIWLGESVCNVEDGILMDSTTCFTIVGNYIAFNGGAGVRMVNSTNGLVAFDLFQGNAGGSIVSTNSTYVGIANRTIAAPTRDGSCGSAGNCTRYSNSHSHSDDDCSGLDD